MRGGIIAAPLAVSEAARYTRLAGSEGEGPMKKVIAVVGLGATLVAISPLAAQAHGGAVSAALALGAFATFAVLTAPFWALAAYPAVYPPVPHPAPVYYAPGTTYANTAPAPVTPAVQREVIYPHGRHVLYGDGVTVAYRWVWVPNPPPPPPPALEPPPGPPPAPPPSR
jgi:hypothetical protein